MKRLLRRTGKIVLWFFASMVVVMSGVIATMWVHDNTPWGCELPDNEEIVPGSPLDKAVEKLRIRAVQKYPTIDFTKRKIELPDYREDPHPTVWYVTYNEPMPTNVFGCHIPGRFSPGVSISAVVRKSDLAVTQDMRIDAH